MMETLSAFPNLSEPDVSVYDKSTGSISSLSESNSSSASASLINSSNVCENPSASDWASVDSTLRVSYHQSRCNTPADDHAELDGMTEAGNRLADPQRGVGV